MQPAPNREQVIKSRIFSPGLIDHQVVHFLHSGGGNFWIRNNLEENWQKEKSKYVLVSQEKVIAARLQYLQHENNWETEFQTEVSDQLLFIKQNLYDRGTALVKIIQQFNRWRNGKFDSLEELLKGFAGDNDNAAMQNKALNFFRNNPDAAQYGIDIQNVLRNNDYQALYLLIDFVPGEPMHLLLRAQDIDFTKYINCYGMQYAGHLLDESNILIAIAVTRAEYKYFPV